MFRLSFTSGNSDSINHVFCTLGVPSDYSYVAHIISLAYVYATPLAAFRAVQQLNGLEGDLYCSEFNPETATYQNQLVYACDPEMLPNDIIE